MNNIKVIIGSDHAGFYLKNKIIQHLIQNNIVVEDIGCYDTNSTDYPVIAKQLASIVVSDENLKGILICGTGVGMSIAANKIKGIRAVVCSDVTSAKYSRMHNDTNILCLGERIVGEYLAIDICDIWLNTNFEKQRHLKRVNLLEN